MQSKLELEAILAAQIKEAALPEPERDYRFHPLRGWRVSFAFTEAFIICDVPARGRSRDADYGKQNAAVLAGWIYLRVTSLMIEDGRALAYIERALEEWG